MTRREIQDRLDSRTKCRWGQRSILVLMGRGKLDDWPRDTYYITVAGSICPVRMAADLVGAGTTRRVESRKGSDSMQRTEAFVIEGDYMTHLEESPDIEITGINGLRTLMAMIAGSWNNGLPVILKGREVKFIPRESKPEHIYCEILPVVYPSTKVEREE